MGIVAQCFLPSAVLIIELNIPYPFSHFSKDIIFTIEIPYFLLPRLFIALTENAFIHSWIINCFLQNICELQITRISPYEPVSGLFSFVLDCHQRISNASFKTISNEPLIIASNILSRFFILVDIITSKEMEIGLGFQAEFVPIPLNYSPPKPSLVLNQQLSSQLSAIMSDIVPNPPFQYQKYLYSENGILTPPQSDDVEPTNSCPFF